MAKITVGAISYEGTIEEIKELMAMSDAEFPEEGPKEVPLKVGDYAKVVGVENTKNSCGGKHCFEIGEVVKVVSVFSSGKGYGCERLEGRTAFNRSVSNADIIKVDGEELTKAKTEQERKLAAKKWAKIGRKPNEFKKGDIVRYVGNGSANGSLQEVYADTVGGKTKVKFTDVFGVCTERNENIELIAPVEAKFNA